MVGFELSFNRVSVDVTDAYVSVPRGARRSHLASRVADLPQSPSPTKIAGTRVASSGGSRPPVSAAVVVQRRRHATTVGLSLGVRAAYVLRGRPQVPFG